MPFAGDKNGSYANTQAAQGAAGVPVTLTYAATLSPALGDGAVRRCTMTGDATLNPPSGPFDGARWECRFIASASNRALTTHANILIPSDSTFTSPVTCTSGKTYVMLLKYDGTLSKWLLVSWVGGFA